jgi:hypothetical protein
VRSLIFAFVRSPASDRLYGIITRAVREFAESTAVVGSLLSFVRNLKGRRSQLPLRRRFPLQGVGKVDNYYPYVGQELLVTCMLNKAESDSRRTKAMLVVALVALIIGGDVVLRSIDQRLSGNLAHIQEIPEIIRRIGSDDSALLVIGNSLTNNGVASAGVATALPNFQIGKVTPDGSNFWDWNCILKHQIVASDDVRFRAIVMGYAWHLLSDQTQPNASRLGGLFCQWSDLLQPSEMGLSHSSDIGEFIAARALRMYALREILRNRFFQRVIPSYEQYTQAANRAAQAGAASGDEVEAQYSYAHLAALASQLKAKGARLIVVAMPVQNEYPIDPGLQALAQKGALTIYDYRRVEGIDAASFEDSMHLNKNGQAVLSAQLATKLAADIATDDKAAP